MQISFQPQDSSLYIEITPSTSWKENPKPWRSLQIKKDELCWCQGRVRQQLDKLPKFLVAKNKALKDGKTSKMMFWSLYRHHLIQFIWRKRMAATFNFCVPTLQKLWRSMEFSIILSKTSGQELHVILYHDEVTAGNVLAPLKHQKATLFYVGFLDSRFNLI